jgi:hypothetical protein
MHVNVTIPPWLGRGVIKGFTKQVNEGFVFCFPKPVSILASVFVKISGSEKIWEGMQSEFQAISIWF